MMQTIKKIVKNSLTIYRMKKRENEFKKEIEASYKKLEQHRSLTKEQEKEVQDFYKSLIGKKVPLIWHKYFYSRTGHFTKEYVPIGIHHCEIIPRANDWRFLYAYNDKNITDLLFPGENVARSILKKMNDYYYFEGKPVSEKEAIELCANLKDVIIKPSRETQGRGVQLFSATDGVTDINGMTIAKLFEEYQHNFMIQRRVHQHKDLAALNPTSVNTLRVVSFRSGMEVLIVYSVIRIGRKGQVIDNQCAGGISTMVGPDGRLSKNAFGGYTTDNVPKTDTGIVLEGYQYPSYDKAIAFVKRLHMQLPFFNMIGWDVAIEENGDPILIEFNNNPQLSQSAFGSGYGKYTERIIRETWAEPHYNTRFPLMTDHVKPEEN
ncbi:MAG: hypothetical protein IJR13_06625 [Bacteroidales bacterium]|nr:hypothetical protein [Bacteroidales bacterium]